MQSVFAHGNLLTDAELELMAARGAAVAHCPLSNMYYAGWWMPGTAGHCWKVRPA